MNEKPMVINLVMNGKAETVTMGIGDLLNTVDLKTRFSELLFKQAKARGLKKGSAADDFIFSQLDALKAYVNANKKDGSTIDELKALIIEWLKEQEAEAEVKNG